MRGVLRKITQKVDPSKLSAVADLKAENKAQNGDSSETITHAWFWPRVGQFLKENDIVITETGTANFGIWDAKFPKGVTALSQVLWGSIGYSVGACQGAALAARDAGLERRTILFVGDGRYEPPLKVFGRVWLIFSKPSAHLPGDQHYHSPWIETHHVNLALMKCFNHSLIFTDSSSATTALRSSDSSTAWTLATMTSFRGISKTS